MAAPIGGPIGPANLLATCNIPNLKAAWSGLDMSVINAYVAATHIPIPPLRYKKITIFRLYLSYIIISKINDLIGYSFVI